MKYIKIILGIMILIMFLSAILIIYIRPDLGAAPVFLLIGQGLIPFAVLYAIKAIDM